MAGMQLIERHHTTCLKWAASYLGLNAGLPGPGG